MVGGTLCVLIKAHHNNLPRGSFWGMAAPRDVDVGQLVKKIEESQYGFDSTLQGPFGAKRGESTLKIKLFTISLIFPSLQLCTQTTLPLES